MADIDVTELFADPDFIDPMELITRFPTINSLGENVLSERTQRSVGCIQPAPERTVQKLPEAMRVEDLSAFWFRGTIVATAPGKYASILVFRGKRYQVRSVNDWSNWGQGWCEGLCVAEVPA